jgi:hypothetical protein
MGGRDPLDLASEAFALIDGADPDRVVIPDSVSRLLQHWADLKPELVALGASDPDPDVQAAAVSLRNAGNGLLDCLAQGLEPLRISELEDLIRSFPKRHAEALIAAERLLSQLA